MDKNKRVADRMAHIESDRLYSIAQSARTLGVCRSYLYYCFDNNPDFPKPTVCKGRRWLTGKDLQRIMGIRSFLGL